jgi:aminoglycoside phosphotransferase (APT) family kinase protein
VNPSLISTAEIEAALTGPQGTKPGSSIVSLLRKPFAYRTSFPVEEVDVELEGGSVLRLLLKDLRWDALSDDARRAKPALLHDASREAEVYRLLLPAAPAGPPECYGTAANWLLVERVAGRELYQVGEFHLWEEAARWLARLHARFASQASPPSRRLILYDEAYYQLWPERAATFTPAPVRRRLRSLADRYDRVIERLLALPSTLLHGEFYASNILVQEGPVCTRVCAVDWEMAAWGPGLFDLAALVSGRWTDTERSAMASAYCHELQTMGVADDSYNALDWCRLHLAVQWAGWSPDWAPPADQAFDWAGEAIALADRLGFWG